MLLFESNIEAKSFVLKFSNSYNPSSDYNISVGMPVDCYNDHTQTLKHPRSDIVHVLIRVQKRVPYLIQTSH